MEDGRPHPRTTKQPGPNRRLTTVGTAAPRLSSGAKLRRPDEITVSYAVRPVARAPMPMCDCQNDSVGSKSRVHNDEWKLVKGVSSAAGEVDRPAMGSFSDCSDGPIKSAFKADRSGRASLLVPL